jgi:predicted ATPase
MLEDDTSNLGLVLSRLALNGGARARIVGELRNLYEGISDFQVHAEAGTVQLYLMEGPFSIPANRLSDGTLRYLTLLAILCDPNPSPLICIEEPELGLHPDVIPGHQTKFLETDSIE